MIKLKNKMEKWNFSSKEDLIIALEGYIIETPLGYCLSGELLEKINSVGKIKTPKIVNDNLDNFIDKVWEILPKKNHLVGGQPFKPSKNDFKDRITIFNTKYAYTQEVVYNALKMYISEVSECSEQDRQFKKTLLYFIWKDREGSRLSAYCENVLNGEGVKQVDYSNYEL
jgi:hypothetical protein